MKTITKTLLAAVITVIVCLTCGSAQAQQSISTWWVNQQTNLPPPNPFTNNTANANVIVYPMQKGFGIGEPSGTSEYGGNNWTNAVAGGGGSGLTDTEANAILDGHYLTYAIQAAPGYTISFSTNLLYYHVSSTGPGFAELQYSTDGINYSDISSMNYAGGSGNGTVTGFLTNILSGVSALQNVSSTVTNYFRIVNWGATGSAGTWYIYDNPTGNPQAGTNGFSVFGTVAPVPPAQNLVTWWPTGLANGGGTPPAPFNNNFAAPNLVVTPFTKGTGIGAITTASVYGGNGWTNAVAGGGGSGSTDTEANAILDGHYITYAVQAASGYTITFFTNVIFYHNSATGPVNGELQYSTNGINFSDVTPMTYAPAGTAETLVMTNNLSGFSYLRNVPSTVTNYFRIVNWGATGSAGTWYLANTPPAGTLVGTNSFVVIGGLNSLNGVLAPTNLVISPLNQTVNAGQTVGIGVSASGSTASNFWYQIIGSTTNLITGATSSTLTLSNVLGANSGQYFAILTNSAGSATSAVATVTVIDPVLEAEPSSVQGLTKGTVQFAVSVFGTAPLSYQWYYSDTNGNLMGAVNSGVQVDGSGIYGTTNDILTLTNLQATDLTNFVVIATNIYGAVTSTVASFAPDINLSTPVSLVSTGGMLALWDFDGSQFTNTAINPNSINSPTPFIGSGIASAVGTCAVPGTSPFSGATDPDDIGNPNGEGYVNTPFGFEQPSPNFSWGTEDYPAQTNYPAGVAMGGNKQNGVQFTTSTVGARNIKVSYDSRVSSTASDYERLQYTTNGTTWVDYPASSTFSGLSGSGNAGFYTFNYDLTGFPGVDNNPSFGIRVVTEWVGSATYGVIQSNFWAATANSSYDSGASGNYAGGTITYDIVAITGDAITNNNNQPPTISSFANTNMVDTNTLVLNFTASSPQMPSSNLHFTAQTVNTVAANNQFVQTVNPTLNVVPTGGNNFALQISFTRNNYIPDPIDAAPILVTATDTNGESFSTWFILTVGAINQPPTNTLTAISSTNMLANKSLTIPFTVGSARNPSSNFIFTVTSDNNTVIPYQNAVISGNTNTGNLFLTVTPAANEVGNTVISVTVDDNDPSEPRTTTANISFVVRPNPNVVAIDYFNYDNSGSLDTIAPSYWQHLSGITGGMQAGGGTAVVSDQATENMEARLINAPFTTNSGGTLYYSCTVNMNPSYLTYSNGSYFIALNDGSGVTANVEDLLVATTNGVTTPGDYRLGIANVVGATGANSQIFPEDLTPGVNYVIITSLALSNGFSTLWIDPTNILSQHVTDTTAAASQTNLYNIADIELRESGTFEGVINVGRLTVGTAFNNVFYPPYANPDTLGVTENSSGNVLNPLANDGGSDLIITGVSPDSNGTATIGVGGTNIIYSATNVDYTGTATVGYTIVDDLGETSNSIITLTITDAPPLALAITNTVVENSVNNLFNVLTNDVLKTPGGTLSLTGVNETDGNGTAGISGTNVVFTPTASFLGTASIGYTISDGLGGTSSSTMTVYVISPIAPSVEAALISGGNLVMSWSDPSYSLQTTTNLLGTWTTISGATSPYTNNINTTTNAAFFRLVH